MVWKRPIRPVSKRAWARIPRLPTRRWCTAKPASGMPDPLAPIAGIVKAHVRCLIVDAMSRFGAIPLDVAQPAALSPPPETGSRRL